MKKSIVVLALAAAVMSFTGCSQLYNSNEVSIAETNQILTYETGVVTGVKKVVIKDNGSGVMIGAMSGTVLGSLMGNGKGNILSTLIGGLTGAFVGYEADKANAEELFIKLNNGQNIVVIVKGVNIQPGDKVRIIKNGNKVVRVEKI
jgi:outer membrane lipoprotein SlyB